MATIATTFSLRDNVSGPMSNIRSSVQSTVKGFESMEGKLVALNSALDLMSKGMEALSGIAKTVTGAFGQFVSDAGEYESLMASLTTSLGSASEAQVEFAKLKDFASKTPFDMPGVVQASVMFRNAGVEADKIIPTISRLGDMAQGNNEYFQRMALNFMQIKSVGKATAMDLNQFAGMGVPIKQVLAEMGVTGTATAEDIENAMIKMTSAGGKFYNSMMNNATTLDGVMSNVGDNMQQISATIGNQVLSTVKEMAGAINNFISELMSSNVFSDIMVRVKETVEYIKYNLDSIIAVMIQVGTVATITGTVMATAWMVAHWPIALVIAGVITLIRLMFDLTQSANEASQNMTGSFNQVSESLSTLCSVMGAVGSFFGGLFNIIYNVFALVVNTLMSISEMFMNIPNVVMHPIQTIKKFFIDMAIQVLDILSTLGGAIDFIFGSKISENLNKASSKLRAFEKEVAPDMFYYDKANMKDVNWMGSGAFSGAKMGAEAGALIDDALHFNKANPWSGDQTPEKYKSNISTSLSSMPEISQPQMLPIDSNGNMKVAVQNEIKISDEYKQLLAEQAVEKYKVNFQQVTPSINLGGVTISNEADIDSLMDQLSMALSEASTSSLY